NRSGEYKDSRDAALFDAVRQGGPTMILNAVKSILDEERETGVPFARYARGKGKPTMLDELRDLAKAMGCNEALKDGSDERLFFEQSFDVNTGDDYFDNPAKLFELWQDFERNGNAVLSAATMQYSSLYTDHSEKQYRSKFIPLFNKIETCRKAFQASLAELETRFGDNSQLFQDDQDPSTHHLPKAPRTLDIFFKMGSFNKSQAKPYADAMKAQKESPKGLSLAQQKLERLLTGISGKGADRLEVSLTAETHDPGAAVMQALELRETPTTVKAFGRRGHENLLTKTVRTQAAHAAKMALPSSDEMIEISTSFVPVDINPKNIQTALSRLAYIGTCLANATAVTYSPEFRGSSQAKFEGQLLELSNLIHARLTELEAAGVPRDQLAKVAETMAPLLE
ncbi:MAG: hypothetical protein ACI9BD_000642, partial [Candidatus Marinamargulisbacteria bacterium]